MLADVDYLADQLFSRLVLGMGFSGEYELDAVIGEIEEKFQVAENEGRPLVGGGAAGKADR